MVVHSQHTIYWYSIYHVANSKVNSNLLIFGIYHSICLKIKVMHITKNRTAVTSRRCRHRQFHAAIFRPPQRQTKLKSPPTGLQVSCDPEGIIVPLNRSLNIL